MSILKQLPTFSSLSQLNEKDKFNYPKTQSAIKLNKIKNLFCPLFNVFDTWMAEWRKGTVIEYKLLSNI